MQMRENWEKWPWSANHVNHSMSHHSSYLNQANQESCCWTHAIWNLSFGRFILNDFLVKIFKVRFARFQNCRTKHQRNFRKGVWLVSCFSFFIWLRKQREFSKQHELRLSKEMEEIADNGSHWPSIRKHWPTTSLDSLHVCDSVTPLPLCLCVCPLLHLCIATTVLCLWLYVHSDSVTTILPALVWSTVLSLLLPVGTWPCSAYSSWDWSPESPSSLFTASGSSSPASFNSLHAQSPFTTFPYGSLSHRHSSPK